MCTQGPMLFLIFPVRKAYTAHTSRVVGNCKCIPRILQQASSQGWQVCCVCVLSSGPFSICVLFSGLCGHTDCMMQCFPGTLLMPSPPPLTPGSVGKLSAGSCRLIVVQYVLGHPKSLNISYTTPRHVCTCTGFFCTG